MQAGLGNVLQPVPSIVWAGPPPADADHKTFQIDMNAFPIFMQFFSTTWPRTACLMATRMPPTLYARPRAVVFGGVHVSHAL